MVRFDVLTVKKAKAEPLDSRFRGNDGGEGGLTVLHDRNQYK